MQYNIIVVRESHRKQGGQDNEEADNRNRYQGLQKGGTQILGAGYGVSEPWLENHDGEVREGTEMKVKVYCINKGTASQYYGLKDAEENFILHYTPTWKTEKGAIRWAEKNGYKVVK